MPALLTTQSMRPKASSAVWTIRFARAQVDTLSVLATAVPPRGADLVDHALRRPLRRRPRPASDAPMSLTTTFAPAAAERERHLAADAAAGAGDDRNLAFEHLAPPSGHIRMMSNCSCV